MAISRAEADQKFAAYYPELLEAMERKIPKRAIAIEADWWLRMKEYG